MTKWCPYKNILDTTIDTIDYYFLIINDFMNNFIGDSICRQIKETGLKPSIKITDFECARLSTLEKEHFYGS